MQVDILRNFLTTFLMFGLFSRPILYYYWLSLSKNYLQLFWKTFFLTILNSYNRFVKQFLKIERKSIIFILYIIYLLFFLAWTLNCRKNRAPNALCRPSIKKKHFPLNNNAAFNQINAKRNETFLRYPLYLLCPQHFDLCYRPCCLFPDVHSFCLGAICAFDRRIYRQYTSNLIGNQSTQRHLQLQCKHSLEISRYMKNFRAVP